MAEYYAVERSPEYLAHYGIRGMKWGVRKAIKTGSERRLSRQYAKAQKRLQKLRANASSTELNKRADRLDKASKGARIVGRIGAGVALGGTGGRLLSSKLRGRIMDNFNGTENTIRKSTGDMWNTYYKTNTSYNPNEMKNWTKNAHAENNAWAKAQHKKVDTLDDVSRYAQMVGAGMAAGGYGYALGAKLRANSLRKRSNDSAKMREATKKADAWEREMKSAFKGTKYANGKRVENKNYVIDLRSKKRRAKAGATGKRIKVVNGPVRTGIYR